MDVVDDVDFGIRYSGDWVQQGVLRDFDSTVHATCNPGSSFTFTFNGTNISVFGTILSETQATSLYSIDGNRQDIFTAPQVSQDMHRALLFTQRNLGNGEHTLTTSFVNSTSLPSDGTSCFSFDFLMYPYTSENPVSTSSMGNQGNITGIDQTNTATPSSHPALALSTSRQSTIIIGVALAVFFTLQLVVILVLFRWHKRAIAMPHPSKDSESQPPSRSSSPISPSEASRITPFSQRPSRPPTISLDPAAVYSSVESQGSQRGGRSTLPPYPPSRDADVIRPNLRLQKIRREMERPSGGGNPGREVELESSTLPPSYA